MEAKHANFCKDVLYEIRNSEPLIKIRTEWSKLQNRCITQSINAPENLREPERELHKCPWKETCKTCESESRLILTTNKLSVEITQESDFESILNFIRSGVFNFGIDLFFGSVQQNLDVLVRLQEAALQQSETLGYSIPLSIYLKLSPRMQFTGGLEKNKQGFSLNAGNRIVVTTNRNYASHCSHKVVYVNAKFLMFDLKKCDIICLGKDIQLLVVDLRFDRAICKVLTSGVLTGCMPVKFPYTFEWVNERVSAEELEDMTFAMGTNNNVIVSHAPGCLPFYEQLRETLTQFKCESYYLFTRLTLANLKTMEDAKWIVSSYDGFLLDCSKQPPQDRIVKLSTAAQYFIEKTYRIRKPLFLSGTWSMYVHSSDYKAAFYYPDKFVLPCNPEYLRLFEAVFHKYAPKLCTDGNFVDKSLTGSDTIARSIAAASFDLFADAIVMATVAGRMAIKVAHFRPNTPIIAVTTTQSQISYASMHHNIWMLLFDKNSDNEVSHKKDNHQKLVYGVRYGVVKRIIRKNSTIILVYRQLLRYGFTDKFVVIKYDEGYVETIKRAILQK